MDFVSLSSCNITVCYKGRASAQKRTWESVLTRSIVAAVGNEYFRIVVIVTGTLLTSYVLQAIPQVIAVSRSQVSLGLKRLGSFKVLRTFSHLECLTPV
jgi:hypothetical protein